MDFDSGHYGDSSRLAVPQGRDRFKHSKFGNVAKVCRRTLDPVIQRANKWLINQVRDYWTGLCPNFHCASSVHLELPPRPADPQERRPYCGDHLYASGTHSRVASTLKSCSS